MHIKLTALLVSALFATGVAAQALDTERKAAVPDPGDELRQFSEVVNPSGFTLPEEILWGVRAVLAPASFRGKVPLFVYNPADFKCGHNKGGALIKRNYRVTKLGRFKESRNQDEPSGPLDIEFKSWASRNAYCDDRYGGKTNSKASPVKPSPVPSDIWIEMFESLEEDYGQVLISSGPIAGGEPVAKWWGQCDYSKIREGLSCADRLGRTVSPSIP